MKIEEGLLGRWKREGKGEERAVRENMSKVCYIHVQNVTANPLIMYN
jgi:hypothetical protein